MSSYEKFLKTVSRVINPFDHAGRNPDRRTEAVDEVP